MASQNPDTASTTPAFRKDRCPITGLPNQCAAEQKPPLPVCWCGSATIPAALIRLVPEPAKDRACLARETVEAYHFLVQTGHFGSDPEDIPAARRALLREALARRRAGPAVSLLHAWRDILEKLASCGITDTQLLFLGLDARALSEVRSVLSLLQAEARGGQAPDALDALIERVDASDFKLQDWITGLDLVARFAQSEGRATRLQAAAGYLECCTSAAAAGSNNDFPGLVRAMLEAHGFQGE